MAETKYLNYEGLSAFKDLLTKYIDNEEAQSLKSVLTSDDEHTIYFYKVADPTENTQPAYIIELPNVTDGVSPIVDVSKSNGVTTITITDIDGEHTATINDGEKGDKGDTGDKGDKGDKGDTGADGYTPVKGVDYWTSQDIAEIENDLDGKYLPQCDDVYEEDVDEIFEE